MMLHTVRMASDAPNHNLTTTQLAALDNGTDEFLDVETAADLCQVSPITIRAWVRRYNLPHAVLGGYLLILDSALVDCERARRHAPERPWVHMRRLHSVTSTAGGQPVS